MPSDACHVRRATCGRVLLLLVFAAHGLALAAQPFQTPGTVLDRILAVVSGGLILQSDVNAALRLGLITVPTEGDRMQVALDRLIERQLMLLEVDRYAPPEPSGAEIDASLAVIDKRIGSGERLDAILRETGYTLPQLRLYVRDELRIRAYLLQRFGAPASPLDEEMLEYYRAHQKDFTREGVVRPFTEVREDVRQALLAERRATLVREWLASLRRRTEVNILYLPGR